MIFVFQLERISFQHRVYEGIDQNRKSIEIVFKKRLTKPFYWLYHSSPIRRVMRWVLLLLPFFPLSAVDFDFAVSEMIHTGACLNRLNLCSGFCGCFSWRLNEDRIAITDSWRHKGELRFDDFLLIDFQGSLIGSARTCPEDFWIHNCLFRCFDRARAVIHTHSVSAIALTRLLAGQSCLILEGVQIPSFFHPCSHKCRLEVPIFENCQTVSALAAEIESVLRKKKHVFGFFIRGDGFYTWGWDMKEARCRAEFFERQFEAELLLRCNCAN